MAKIIFFGTPGFAVPTLNALHDAGHTIAGVVTAPGKNAGRGLKIKDPEVKIAAEKLRLQVYQPIHLSDPVFLKDMERLQAEIFVVVAFRMMPEKLWSIPAKGTFNIHASLLPLYRGAAPINHAIMNGEKETGVTAFFLQHEIDTGNIIMQEKMEIGENETAGELHDRLMIAGARLAVKTVDAIVKNEVKSISQKQLIAPGELLKPAPKIFPADCKINWHQDAETVHNHVRGLSPYPGAFTKIRLNDVPPLVLKIYRTIPNEEIKLSPGSIFIKDRKLFIGCATGTIEIIELQLEGRKKVKASEFINGFQASTASIFADN